MGSVFPRQATRVFTSLPDPLLSQSLDHKDEVLCSEMFGTISTCETSSSRWSPVLQDSCGKHCLHIHCALTYIGDCCAPRVTDSLMRQRRAQSIM